MQGVVSGNARRMQPPCEEAHEKQQKYSFGFSYLRPYWLLHAIQRTGYAAHAGKGVAEARRAVFADQVTARLGKEPGADVYCA